MTDYLPHIDRAPDYGLSRSDDFDVDTINFGDGYEQRRTTGINPVRRTYVVTWAGLTRYDYQTIYDFLRSRKGVYAFYWVVPDSDEVVKVVCDSLSEAIESYDRRTVEASFREVFE